MVCRGCWLLLAVILVSACAPSSAPDRSDQWPPPAPWAAAPDAAGSSGVPGLPSAPQPAPPVSTHPGDSPFTAAAHGTDLSYPQCSEGAAPAGAAFSVVGVNGGRAFSLNPCFLRQWRAAPVPRSLYLNSGYNPGNAGKVVPACRERASAEGGTPDQQLAYALGCSTARD